MIFVPIGSNCSITWWLKYYDLRKCAFPFDWCKCTLDQLFNILNNDFDDFVNSLCIKHLSDKHLTFDGEPSMIITNNYGIEYAHEVIVSDLTQFSKSIQKRIDRFRELSKEEHITYVRIELKKFNKTQYDKLLRLITKLELINHNFTIKLIIHESSIEIIHDKIKVYHFSEFTSDWKMSYLNWHTILTD